MKSRVFISYKHSDKNGNKTEDYSIAKEIYYALNKKNVPAFFSEETLYKMGKSEYKKAIDEELDNAEILIVVATCDEYIKSGWVEYEYETFYVDILSGRKPDGQLLSYTKNITRLPRTLSLYENKSIVDNSIDLLVQYICNALKPSQSTQEETISTVVRRDDFEKEKNTSAYSSDYKNELNRLEIQAINSRESDFNALKYYYDQIGEIEDGICVLDVGSAYGFVAADRFGNDNRVKKILCIDKNERVIERAQVLFAENEKMCFHVIDVESEDFISKLKSAMQENGIDKIDLVFSALTLHHLKDPCRTLRKIRSVLESGAHIILRGSDDGSKLCHPNFELMQKIIEMTVTATKVSDRYNGRKIHSQLINSGFKDVKMFSYMRDISKFDFEERESLYNESFSYRINYFAKMLEANPDSEKCKKDYKKMENYLEEFENAFYEKNFWYCEYDYIGIAKK